MDRSDSTKAIYPGWKRLRERWEYPISYADSGLIPKGRNVLLLERIRVEDEPRSHSLSYDHPAREEHT